MNPEAQGPRARVIVAVGYAVCDPTALAAAAQLAQSTGTELAALFVEDVNLLRLVELPFAFEIGTASGTPRRLAASDVERAFRNRAGELKRAMSDLAASLQFDLSFEIARGRPVRALLEASGEHDLVVLAGVAARSLFQTPAASIVRDALRAAARRTANRPAPPVAAVLQSAASAPRVLEAALGLARAADAELAVLLLGRDARDAGLTDAAEKLLAKQDVAARLTVLPDPTPENIARVVAEEGAQVLFWPGDGGFEIAADVELLLAAINCPLIVVR